MPLRLCEDLEWESENSLGSCKLLRASIGEEWQLMAKSHILDNLPEQKGKCFRTWTFCSYTAMYRTLNLKAFGDYPTTDDMMSCKSTQVHPRNFLEEVDPIQVGVIASTLLWFAYFMSNHVYFLSLSKNMIKLLLLISAIAPHPPPPPPLVTCTVLI